MTLSLGSCFSAEMGRRMAEAGMEQYDSLPRLVLLRGDGQEDGGSGDGGVRQSIRGAVQSGFGRLVAAAAGGRTALRTGGRRPAGHQSGAGGTAAESRVAGAPSHCP